MNELEAKYMAMVDTDPGPEACWRWRGKMTRGGYGYIQQDGLMRLAHRIAYERWVAPIVPGHTIDHLCRNRECSNPNHLEQVTLEENSARVPGREPNPRIIGRKLGRSRKRPEDRYVTPARSFRPHPPEVWERAKAKAAREGETITDVLNRFLADYTKGEK